MCRVDWELASWIATTIASALAVLGLGFVALQLCWQRRQSRLDFLHRLYSEFDTHDARLNREYIYLAPAEQLRFEVLHSPDADKKTIEARRKVEETLAMLSRLAYPVAKGQVPADDAFELYGGVLLQVAHRLWPYVEDQRERRREGGFRHRNSYRQHLEKIVREWAPKYAKAANLNPPSRKLPTKEMLLALSQSNRLGSVQHVFKFGCHSLLHAFQEVAVSISGESNSAVP